MRNNWNEEVRSFIPSFASPPFWVEMAGISYGAADYSIQHNDPKHAVLEFVLDGVGYVDFDGTAQRVTKDTLYFLPRFSPHRYWSDSKEPYSKIFLNLYGHHLESLLHAYKLDNLQTLSIPSIKPLFLKIPEIIRQPMNESDMQAALQGVALEIFAHLLLKSEDSIINKEALVLRDYLHHNVHRMVPNTELADVIFRSPTYCINLFRKEFGTTPYTYQLDRKISIAKSLLSTTSFSVKEVAAQLGYDNQHYFSNLFLQKSGMRPLEYRKKKQ